MIKHTFPRHPTARAAALVVAAVLSAGGLAACTKQDEQAAKAAVDTAVSRGEQAARDAQAKAAEAAKEAKQATAELGRDAKEAADKAAADARAAAQTAGADIRQSTAETRTEVSAALSKAGDLIDDAAITAAVKASLANDPDLSAIRINVDTKDGVVTLTGPASSAAAKTKANALAMNVKGVKSVQNNLTVG